MARAAKVMRQSGCRLIGFSFGNEREPRNRMREIFTSGSVGRAPGNRRFYPEADAKSRAADLNVIFLNNLQNSALRIIM